jgi:hypothetical protein
MAGPMPSRLVGGTIGRELLSIATGLCVVAQLVRVLVAGSYRSTSVRSRSPTGTR